MVVSSRSQEACDEIAKLINARGRGRAAAIAANIGRKPEIEQLVAAARQAVGPIGILVCNAASNPYYGSMSGISDELFEKTIRNNLMSTHWLAQFVRPDMQAAQDGAIIMVGSIGAMRGSAVIGAYNITKAADVQLARNLAVELGGDNIRVNCIAPGLVRTDFARALWENPANLERALSGTPLKRIGDAVDIAGAAVFLASAAGRYVTGQTIVVDGGATVTAGGV